MFFIGVISIGNKNKKIADISFKCTGCIGKNFSVIELSRNFELFFIPVYRLKKEYIIICDKCRSVYKLKKDKVVNVLEKKEATYDDIEKIILENEVCPYCGSNIIGDYIYCPKCGKSLKK